MTMRIKARLATLAAAMVLVALAIGWAAHTSLRQVSQLSDKLTSEQIESFQAADKFRANLQALNSILFNYQLHPGTNTWAKVNRTSPLSEAVTSAKYFQTPCKSRAGNFLSS